MAYYIIYSNNLRECAKNDRVCAIPEILTKR